MEAVVAAPLDEYPPRAWWIAFSVTMTMLLFGGYCVTITFYKGLGVWGINVPVAWGFDIVNFVFWVGIGHAGTLISAILFLLRQRWRVGIARFAEAMTIFAVICAGMFPLLHLGRPWLPLYLFPYPSQHGVWVNFTSPLLWDVFAVSTYLTVSFVFWYVGLIPDLATLRDRTGNPLKKTIYAIFSLGWRHSNRHWQHYERAYLILAGFATPLVLSVHTIVSFDFAVSVMPGWHSTIFPPYFVAGAVFSGFAMVQNVLIFVRSAFKLKHVITLDHLEKMNKVMIVTGSMVGYAYAMEFFIAWYSGSQFEQFVFLNRALGPYAWAYWTMISCNALFPQLFWFRRVRRSIPVMFAIGVLVNLGMWLERFVIIVTSLHRDYLPSSWGMYIPTMYDIGILIGSFGLFFTLILIFIRVLPVISIAEVKALLEGAQPRHD
ncbi:MAG TPA: NrfD/PsrC family molybdoenzyme membrane anchor subunit [Bacteroidota bacterium]|nr:NrfD/PsrC family molybdoenzyme membrane anchor subunit [Bacteroidota bacterium]